MERLTEKSEETKNPLKSEHLKEGVSPIIACVGTSEQFKENPGGLELEALEGNHNFGDDSKNQNVDYFAVDDFAYVMSSIDSTNKLSKGFANCTGVLVTGIDKITGKNISFLSHEDSRVTRNQIPNLIFIDAIKKHLQEIKDRSVEGTIDAVIVGGNYFFENYKDKKGSIPNTASSRDDYDRAIELLSKEVKGVLNFEPVVITGPKTRRGVDNVFYDNDNRRLYIMRPEVGRESTGSYLPDDIEKEKKKWEEEFEKKRQEEENQKKAAGK